MPAIARFIDIHAIQTVPYANLNRDDTNAVKTMQYGGEERTRVSSQSWKRATRPYFQSLIGEAALRTRRIGERLARELSDNHGWPEQLAKRAGQHLTVGSGIKTDPPKKNAEAAEDKDWSINAMVYIPEPAIAAFAVLAETHRAELEKASDAKKPADAAIPTKDIQDILRSRNGVINLYGRMLAEIDDAGVDGAVQVAHAFTTHTTSIDIDYFAAVDDITEAWRQTGSAHIGDAEYSTGTFYRYATIDTADLLTNLEGDTDAAKRLATAFAEAFILSIPQAKKTATAPHTIPDLVNITVRKDRPVSYAAAFEQPVRHGAHGGYAAESINALSGYAKRATAFLGTAGIVYQGHVGTTTTAAEHLGDTTNGIVDLINTATATALGR